MTCSNDEKFSSRGLGPSRNFLSLGGPSMALSREEIREHVRGVLGQYGNARGVMLLPPDATREHSGAGEITADCVDALGSRVAGVMPTLGTHRPMNEAEWARMFPGVDPSLHMVHNWRSDVMTLGTFPGNYVKAVTDGIWEEPYPVQINRLVADDHIDLVVSIGQVVPHEVLGMANHMKNVLVGCGGKAGIDQSHYIGALCGIEKVLGQPDNPVRHFLTKALYDFLD